MRSDGTWEVMTWLVTCETEENEEKEKKIKKLKNKWRGRMSIGHGHLYH